MHEQGILRDMEGFRLTAMQYRFAIIRGLYPETRGYPDYWCAKAAGSTASNNTLRKLASVWKKIPAVRQIIDRERGKQIERIELSADEVVDDLREVRDVCMGRRPAAQTVTVDDESRLIEQFSFNASGANKSLELLGRHIGMFHDTLTVEDDALLHMTPEQRRTRMIELANKAGLTVTAIEDDAGTDD